VATKKGSNRNMTESKFKKWLEIAEKVIRLIRPKFHNTITRIVVAMGLTLSVESQVNIFEAFAVAIFEYFFGPSDFLRSLFAGNTNPWVGVIIIVLGLSYNAIVTVGLNLIETYKAAIPKQPDILFSILNSKGETFAKDVTLNGKLCKVPNKKDIPENNSYSEFAMKRIEKQSPSFRVGKISGTSTPVFGRHIDPLGEQINRDFFKERAKFLETWGGADILSLKLENVGEILCKNVNVEFKIKKQNGLSVDNQNDLNPKLPSQETESTLTKFRHYDNHPVSYDIKGSHTNEEYIFIWEIGDLQAKAKKTSRTKIFIRTNEKIKIEITVFCDELTTPIKSFYSISPASELIEVSIKDITTDTKSFFELADTIVMKGYLSSYYNQMVKKMHNLDDKLIPS